MEIVYNETDRYDHRSAFTGVVYFKAPILRSIGYLKMVTWPLIHSICGYHASRG